MPARPVADRHRHVRPGRRRGPVGHRPLPAGPDADGDGLRRGRARRLDDAARGPADPPALGASPRAAIVIYGVVVHRHAGQLPQLRQRADAARQLAPLAGASCSTSPRCAPRAAAGRSRRRTTSSCPTRAGSSAPSAERGRRARRPGSQGAADQEGRRALRRRPRRAAAPGAGRRRPTTRSTTSRCPASGAWRSPTTTPRMSAVEDGRGARAPMTTRPSTRTPPARRCARARRRERLRWAPAVALLLVAQLRAARVGRQAGPALRLQRG